MQDYIIALMIFLGSLGIVYIIRTFLIKKLAKIAPKTKTKIDDALLKVMKEIGFFFYVLLALYVAVKFIGMSEFIKRIISILLLVGISFYAVRIFQKFINMAIRMAAQKKKEAGEPIDEAALELMIKLLGMALWLVAAVLIVSNLGYNVSTLIAGLGIGGIAIAFALQNVLSDIFASFSIYLDKPFKIGDFVVIGEDAGTVKKIGIKTTRIQSLKGEEIVVSNKELTSIRVHNYKKMHTRRIAFSIGVTYDTPVEKLKKISGMIKDIITKTKGVTFDRAHFKEYGNFSLNFEVVYYVNSNDYNVYMDLNQEINLALKKAFEKEKIEFAFPSQTIYLSK